MYLTYLSQYFLGKYTVSTVTVKGSGTQDCMRSVHAHVVECVQTATKDRLLSVHWFIA